MLIHLNDSVASLAFEHTHAAHINTCRPARIQKRRAIRAHHACVSHVGASTREGNRLVEPLTTTVRLHVGSIESLSHRNNMINLVDDI